MTSNIQNYFLNQIFTIPNLDKMMCVHDTSSFIDCCKMFLNVENITYGQSIHNLYLYMNQSYRNEYYFKNTIINQLLLNTPNVFAAAFTELPISKSKADFVIISNNGAVYEIKTDLDNLDRLKSQISDYYKAFPYVNIVVGNRYLKKVKDLLKDSPVGIIVLYDTNKLVCKKKAYYYDANLEYETMFGILRKKEYESIIFQHFGKLPEVNDFYYYRECFKWMQKINKRTLYKDMLDCLRKRNRPKKENMLNDIQYELRAYAYFTKKGNIDMINRLCNEKLEV